jgi:hypothetical protein
MQSKSVQWFSREAITTPQLQPRQRTEKGFP